MIKYIILPLLGIMGLYVSAEIANTIKPIYPQDTTIYYDYVYVREINADTLRSRYPWICNIIRQGIRDIELRADLLRDFNYYHLSIRKSSEVQDFINKMNASKRNYGNVSKLLVNIPSTRVDCLIKIHNDRTIEVPQWLIKCSKDFLPILKGLSHGIGAVINMIFPSWICSFTGIHNLIKNKSNTMEDLVAIFNMKRYVIPSGAIYDSELFLQEYYCPKDYGSIVYINLNDTIVYIEENDFISGLPSTGNSRKEKIAPVFVFVNAQIPFSIYWEINQTPTDYKIKDSFFFLSKDYYFNTNQ